MEVVDNEGGLCNVSGDRCPGTRVADRLTEYKSMSVAAVMSLYLL